MSEQEVEERRPYAELDEPEQAIVQYALPHRIIDRKDVVDELTEDFSEKALQEAFTRLKAESRLFRQGNKSEYVMIRRDLF